MGKDGIECPAFCPTNCGFDEMMCPGGEDFDGCMVQDFCIPAKGTLIFYCIAKIHKYFLLVSFKDPWARMAMSAQFPVQ